MQRVQPADVRTYADIPLRAPAAGTPDIKELRPDMEVRSDAPPTPASEAPASPDRGTVSPFKAVFLFSALWLAALAAYAVGVLGTEGASNLSPEWLFGVAAIAIVPVALALFAAVVMHEANSLRRQTLALAASTHNLLKPDEQSARNVQRLSLAIRRELDGLNTSLDAATKRMAAIEVSANERIALIERTAAAAQERVDKATGKLGAEREKLAQFTQALDSVVLAASETLTTRLQDARAAVRTASESLHAEHGAIAGLVSTLQSASQAVSSKALETSQELERQAQRLDSASEAAAARSEQVIMRHERQRAAFAETIDRLKQENDHMARALDFQREGMNKLVSAMADETRKIGTFTNESARRLDETASTMALRIVETTKLFAREAEKLRTSTDLTMTGLEQAVQSIKIAGDSSFDAAGRLGSVLVGLRDTAASASQQIEGSVGRLSKMLADMPAEASNHVKLLGQMIDEQARSMRELNTRVAAAFDRVQGIEMTRAPNGYAADHGQAPLPLPPPAPRHMQPPSPVRHAEVAEPPVMPSQASRVKQPLPAPPAAHDFNSGVGEAQTPIAGYPQNRPAPQEPRASQGQAHNQVQVQPQGQGPDGQEGRGWFNLARRFVRPSADDADAGADERGNWDMKSLLAAAETKDGSERRTGSGQGAQGVPQFRADPREIQQVEQGAPSDHVRNQAPRMDVPRHEPPATRVSEPAPQRPTTPQQRAPQPAKPAAPPPPAQTSHQVSSRHMIEALQAMAIDLCRFLEDDPPHELLKRYRNGERNVFARRLAGALGPEHLQMIAQKHQSDREFRDTVDRYINQFEALLELTARNDRDNVLVETYLSSQTGRVYMTLASATGRLS